ncbi:MAG TPA: response regulator [Candidatus Dormibacteraeota bacterium]|nr:response regulator [Candidatus Dormibacteraeota bacterium]
MNILVVDDDATLRYVLESSLRRLGHRVVAVQDGVEALTVFAKGHVPLVISDMLMPEIDGLELCRRIRQANRSHYTYVILLTSVEGREGYLNGMRAGADDFLNKPFDAEMLTARLNVAERILKLQSEVKHLAGLLPICACCKKVRDDQNYWHQVETFLTVHTDARFSHSYCPDCAGKLLAEV